MQFTRAFAFLVCASYTLATTCAWCANEVKATPFTNKCYKSNTFPDGGGETVCPYVSRDDV